MTTGALPDLQKGQSGSSGINDIIQLFQSLGPLLGSGKTTTGASTKSSADTGAMSQADELIQQILGSVSNDNLDILQGNTIERAKQAFAPNNIAPNAAGVRGYSDTVNTSMRNEAAARASAEAMTVRLNAVNAANKSASGLVEAKLNATKTTQQQQTQQTGPNNAGKLLSLATPLAIAYNQFSKKKSPTAASPDDTADAGLGADPNSVSDISDGTGGGFPVQDFGDESPLLLSSQSDIPLPLDFGSDPFIADDSISADSVDAPMDIPSGDGGDVPVGDVPVDDVPVDNVSDFSDFNLEDFSDFFADGGIVPGKRPKPTNYEDSALPGNNRSPVASLATGQGLSVPTPSSVAANSKRKIVEDDPSRILTGFGDSSAANSLGDSIGPAPSGLGLGVGLAAAALGVGVPGLGIAMALANALANNSVGVAGDTVGGQIGDDTLGNDLGNDTLGTPAGVGDDGIGGIGSTAGDTSSDATAGNAATAGESGAPAGGDTGDTGDGAAAAGDGGAAAAGGDGGGGGDGGSEFDGGIQDSDSSNESNGIDKKIIHVTPGESVLPVDTTKALQDLFGPDVIDQIIAATHTPLKRKANGRR